MIPLLASSLLCLAVQGPTGLLWPSGAEPVPIYGPTVIEAAAPVVRLPREVALTELRRSPSAFVGESVRCPVHVSAVDRPWIAYLSRFDSGRFLRVEVWGDEQPIWFADDFRDPAPYLFVERASDVGRRLLGARPHERFLLTLSVREIWLGEPWIEIETAHAIEPAFEEGSLLHAARSAELWDAGQRTLAVSELERALASPLPAAVHAALSDLHANRERRLREEPEAPATKPMPPGETHIYRLKLGPENLPPRRGPEPRQPPLYPRRSS